MYPNFCFYRNSQKSALYTNQLVVFHKTSLLKMSERRRLKFEWRRPGVLEKPSKLGEGGGHASLANFENPCP